MRIVVISDSHKRSDIVEKILDAQPEAKAVFFLGDNASDIEDLQYLYPNMRFFILSGNCDYFSTFPSTNMVTFAGKKIFYTHGHTLSVKYGTDNLFKTARQNGCNIALYGHTHISDILYEDGVYFVNPGSCSNARNGKPSYAVIDIEKNGIIPFIVEL